MATAGWAFPLNISQCLDKVLYEREHFSFNITAAQSRLKTRTALCDISFFIEHDKKKLSY